MTYAALGTLVQLTCEIIWNKKQCQFKLKVISTDNDDTEYIWSSGKSSEWLHERDSNILSPNR